MIVRANTPPRDFLPYLGPEATIIHALNCRLNLITAGREGFDTLDIPADIFVGAAFRAPRSEGGPCGFDLVR